MEKPSQWKRPAVFMAALAVIGAFFLIFSYLPTLRSIEHWKNLSQDIQERINRDLEISSTYKTLTQAQRDSLEGVTELIDKRVPFGGDVSGFLSELADAAYETGLKEFNYVIERDRPAESLSGGSRLDTGAVGAVHEIPVQLRFKSEVKPFFTFLNNLTAFERIVEINDLTIHRTGDMMGIEMKVKIYSRKSVWGI